MVLMIDDATSERMGLMAEQETTADCMRALRRWVELHGVPVALYTDRKNVFITDREPTLEEQLAGMEPMTHFGKACWKLGIKIIKARSPQAKGRVERAHGVYQDRYVKELKLCDIDDLAGADKLLTDGFDKTLNHKFARQPHNEQDMHRPVPKGFKLDEIFSLEHTRTVANDWTVRYNNRTFQIHRKNRPLPHSKDKIIVRQLLNGTIQLVHQNHKLKYKELDPNGKTIAKPKPAFEQPTQGPAGTRNQRPTAP
jgi:hypothetical protein